MAHLLRRNLSAAQMENVAWVRTFARTFSVTRLYILCAQKNPAVSRGCARRALDRSGENQFGHFDVLPLFAPISGIFVIVLREARKYRDLATLELVIFCRFKVRNVKDIKI